MYRTYDHDEQRNDSTRMPIFERNTHTHERRCTTIKNEIPQTIQLCHHRAIRRRTVTTVTPKQTEHRYQRR